MARVHACRLQHQRGDVQEQEQADDLAASSSVESSPPSDQVANRAPLQEDDDDDYTLHHNIDTDEDRQSAEVEAPVDTVVDAPAAESAAIDARKIKIGTRVEFLDINGERKIAKIASRTGKVGGQNEKWYNVESNNGALSCVNLGAVRDLHAVSEKREVLMASHKDEAYSAKLRELQSWTDRRVFEEVEDKGQQVLSVR